ncbi:MAG: transglycosylase SLT domain-containing protein [Nitrosarchaeum sp.]|nr:transglycosylase SLT domain-containing protein [Nitrosarchaeum sp.]
MAPVGREQAQPSDASLEHRVAPVAVQVRKDTEQQELYPVRFAFSRDDVRKVSGALDPRHPDFRVWKVLEHYDVLSAAAARNPDVEVRDLAALMAQESGGEDHRARSAYGALGPFQIRPFKYEGGRSQNVNHGFCVSNAGFSRILDPDEYFDVERSAQCASDLLQMKYDKTPIMNGVLRSTCSRMRWFTGVRRMIGRSRLPCSGMVWGVGAGVICSSRSVSRSGRNVSMQSWIMCAGGR